MDLSTLNYPAIVVAGLIAFAIGALWYSPVMFGKAWQRELGFTDEYLAKGNMALTFGLSFVMMLIMSLVLAMFLQREEASWMVGLHHGLLAGVGLVATSIAINMLYQRKSLKLFLIDAGYQVLFMAAMGALLGAWR